MKDLIMQQEEQTQAQTKALVAALKSSFYPGASDSSVAMVLDYCRAAGLDPMTRPVHIVPMWDKATKTMRDTVMPGIGMYRIIADRSGKYAGQDDAEFGPECQQWGITYPQWCKITVHKITPVGRVPYSAKVFWLEAYAVQSRDSDAPNAMWRKRPYGQLEKCAESAALRKAFPEIGAQPTAEEMEGKAMEGMIVESSVVPVVAQPAESRTESLKNALTARAGVATPAVEVEVSPSTPDAKMLNLIVDAIANAPNAAEIEALTKDAADLGFDREQWNAIATRAKERGAELFYREGIAVAQTSSAVKDLAKAVEDSADLPASVKKLLIAAGRAKYKQLVATETAETAAAPAESATPNQ